MGALSQCQKSFFPTSEDELRQAEARCLEVMFHTIELLPEFSADVIEAYAKNGVGGVRAALKELSGELKEEIVRALMRIVHGA
jgi:ABC-type transport system involved in Fe-S cluster assembly fused permease/ATPase subunit